MKDNKIKIYDMALIAMFAAVIAICAWLSVPAAVPFTMQTFGVFLTVGCLGGKKGTIAVLIYLLLGAVGVPVFAGFTGGPGRLIGTTGGYIFGFLFSALVMWASEGIFGRRKWVLLLSMVLGLLVCYGMGTAWFVLIYTKNTGPISFAAALAKCVLPYVLPDIIKIALAFAVSTKLGAIINKQKCFPG